MGDTRVRLVETTLRDGSYAVDFQFTAADTAFIVSTLDAAGVGYIELCHGSGFRNDKSPYRAKVRPAAIDEEHLAAAQSVARRASLGVITGAWAKDDMDVLARYGCKFVRVGLLPHEVLLPESLQTIEAAKKHGLTVSINLMQTQMIPVPEVARMSVELKRAGTDWLYIVDSAGGMMPDTVRAYVRAVVEASGLVVGLHAHHNTGMALADCIAAIEAGATRVDSTLQGIGRGTGNPPTEQLLLLLQSMGHEREVALDPILRLGDLARPLFEDKGQDPTYFASGVAQLHSSNVPLLMKHAESHQRSPRAFLIEVGRGEKKLIGVGVKTLPGDVVDPAVAKTPATWQAEPDDAVVAVVGEQVLKASTRDLAATCEALYVRAAKVHKPSVLHLVPPDQLWFDTAMMWETEGLVGATAPLAGPFTLRERGPATLVVDPALPAADIAAGNVVRCSFRRLVADASIDLAEAALAADPGAVSVEVAGPLRDVLLARLAELGAQVHDGRAARVRIVDGSTGDWAATAAAGSVIILLAPQAGAGAAIARARTAGARVVRPHIGRAVAGRLTALAGLAGRVRSAGGVSVGAVRLVDATTAATDDEVVVDNADAPSQVIWAARDRERAAQAIARHKLAGMLAGKAGL